MSSYEKLDDSFIHETIADFERPLRGGRAREKPSHPYYIALREVVDLRRDLHTANLKLQEHDELLEATAAAAFESGYSAGRSAFPHLEYSSDRDKSREAFLKARSHVK